MRIAAKRVSDSWSRECDVLYFVLLVFTYLLPVVLLILAVKDIAFKPSPKKQGDAKKSGEKRPLHIDSCEERRENNCAYLEERSRDAVHGEKGDHRGG